MLSASTVMPLAGFHRPTARFRSFICVLAYA